MCEPRRDAKGSSYVESAILPFWTRIVRKRAWFYILRTSGFAFR